MFGSNYNKTSFILATECMGPMKGRTDSRVAMRRQMFSRLEPNSFEVMFIISCTTWYSF